MSVLLQKDYKFQLDVPIRLATEGDLRIGKTRVHLDTVVIAHQMGNTAEEIAEHYPALTLSEVYAVIAWYLQNRAEVDAYLVERQAAAEELRRKIEREQGSSEGLRARLEARLAAKGSA